MKVIIRSQKDFNELPDSFEYETMIEVQSDIAINRNPKHSIIYIVGETEVVVTGAKVAAHDRSRVKAFSGSSVSAHDQCQVVATESDVWSFSSEAKITLYKSRCTSHAGIIYAFDGSFVYTYDATVVNADKTSVVALGGKSVLKSI